MTTGSRAAAGPVRRSLRQALPAAPLIVTAVVQWYAKDAIRPHVWVLFYPALYLSTWMGNRRWGFLATLLCTAFVSWLFVPPDASFGSDAKEVFGAAVFFGTGILFTIFHDRLRRTNATLNKANEERRVFEALVENSPDFIGIADAEGTPVYVNPAGRRMVGLSPDHPVASTTIPEYYPAAQRDFAAGVIVKSMVEHGHWTGETCFRNWVTGESIPVLDTHFMIREPDTGRVLGMGTITRDVTEITRLRQRLEDVAQASLSVSEAIGSLPAGSVQAVLETIALNARTLANAEFAAVGMNGNADQVFEHWAYVGVDPRRAAHIGRLPRPVGLLGLVAREDRIVRRRDLRAEHIPFPPSHPVITSFLGVPIRYRGRVEGTLYLANKRGAAEFNDHDERLMEMLAARVGVAIETAHLYAAEGRQREWLQAVVDQLPNGVVLMDADGHVTAENQSSFSLTAGRLPAQDRFGNPATFDLRRPSGESLAPDDFPIIRAIVHQQATHGEELIARCADGRLIPLVVSAVPIRAAGDELAGAVMVLQDVSALKELERMREEWSSIIAHDLQQPISVIVLKSELLLRAGIGDKPRDDVRQILATAKRLSRMVRDLMDASLLETHRMRITLDRLDLGRLVHDVVERFPDGRRTIVRTHDDSQVLVEGDAQRLEQVLTNLLSNAVKYGSAATPIHVEVDERGGDAEIHVSNEGAGIPAEELPLIFERYVRSQATQAAKGLGLGLYIANGIVRAHGGRMWVDSIPGGTTTFSFSLPLGTHVQSRALPEHGSTQLTEVHA